MKDNTTWPRKFRCIGGFVDGTDFLKFYKSGHVRLYLKDGRYQVAKGYGIDYAEKNTRRGVWEELSA